MDYFILFFIPFVIALIFSPHLTQCAALAVHFFVRQGYKAGIGSLFFLSLTEMGIASLSEGFLIFLLQIDIHSKTTVFIGASLLFLLLILHYKKEKIVELPEALPTEVSSMGKWYFYHLLKMPSRFLGYFSFFSILFPPSRSISWFEVWMLPFGTFLGSFLFWWGFQTYISFHPELLVRRKLNIMQNVSLFLTILLILFGLFRIF